MSGIIFFICISGIVLLLAFALWCANLIFFQSSNNVIVFGLLLILIIPWSILLLHLIYHICSSSGLINDDINANKLIIEYNI